MATLKLTAPVDDGRCTLMENGEQYEQLWRFHNRDELKSHLARLDISEAQLAELWAGQEVELAEGLAWPGNDIQENAQRAEAHPAVLNPLQTELRARGRR